MTPARTRLRSCLESWRTDFRSRRQLRLWPQPAKPAIASSCSGCRYCSYGPSRLPVHSVSGSGHAGMIASGVYDMVLGSRILALDDERRNAILQVTSPTGFSLHSRTSSLESSCLSTTLDFARSQGSCLRFFRCLKTPTISSSTTRWSAQAVMFGFSIGEISSRRSTLRKPLQSISSAACSRTWSTGNNFQLLWP